RVNPCPLHVLELEHRQGIVDKAAQIQALEHLLRVLVFELLDVDEVAAKAYGILDGDDVAPLPVRADAATVAQVIFTREVDSLPTGASALPAIPGPEPVRFVHLARWRGEVGLAPVALGGHGARYIREPLEVGDPEILIDVDV